MSKLWFTLAKNFKNSIKTAPRYLPLPSEVFHFSNIGVKVHCLLQFLQNPHNSARS